MKTINQYLSDSECYAIAEKQGLTPVIVEHDGLITNINCF